MPVESNIGFSESTAIKHEQLRKFMRMHLTIVKSIFDKGRGTGPYYFFDLNAGRGTYNGIIGSPLIFIHEAIESYTDYKAIFYEIHEDNAAELERTIGSNPSVQVINASNTEIGSFPQLGSKPWNDPRYGLMFADPNGGHPDWKSISKFYQHKNHGTIDVLLYLSAAGIKRCSCANDGMPRLMEGMNIIGKKHWLVRRPQDKHQWTFLVGTNWENFPAWENRGFYSASHGIGKSILERLHYTASEYKAEKEPKQLSLAYV